MKAFRDDLPIYLQLRRQIEEQILMRVLKEEDPVKSLRVMAQEYRINPITAANAINTLVDEGILYQKRGIGVFVSPDARIKIINSRRSSFVEETLIPAIRMAKGLEIPSGELINTIKKIYEETK